MKQRIHTDQAPKAIGPYSQAVLAGDFLYVSGQIPLDPATGEIVGGTAAEQAAQSLRNLQAILREAGMTFDNVVKTTVLLQDIADFAAVNEVYAQFFGGEILPARAAFAVNALPKGALVEIELVAYKGRNESKRLRSGGTEPLALLQLHLRAGGQRKRARSIRPVLLQKIRFGKPCDFGIVGGQRAAGKERAVRIAADEPALPDRQQEQRRTAVRRCAVGQRFPQRGIKAVFRLIRDLRKGIPADGIEKERGNTGIGTQQHPARAAEVRIGERAVFKRNGVDLAVRQQIDDAIRTKAILHGGANGGNGFIVGRRIGQRRGDGRREQSGKPPKCEKSSSQQSSAQENPTKLLHRRRLLDRFGMIQFQYTTKTRPRQWKKRICIGEEFYWSGRETK